MSCHKGKTAKAVMGCLASADHSIDTEEASAFWHGLDSDGATGARVDPDEAAAAFKSAFQSATRSDSWSSLTASERLAAQNEYHHTLEHIHDGEFTVTENQVRKMNVYTASRKPVTGIRRKAAVIAATAMVAFGGVAAAQPAAAADTHTIAVGVSTNVTPEPVQTVGKRTDGPFAAPRLKAKVVCPPGYVLSDAGKPIPKAAYVKWNGKKAKAKSIRLGQDVCAPGQGTPGGGSAVVEPTTGVKPGKFEIPTDSSGRVTALPKDLVKNVGGRYAVTTEDLAELARQTGTAEFADSAKLKSNVHPVGPPLITAEAPDSVDLLSIERDSQGRLVGTWVARGGKGLALTSTGEGLADYQYIRLGGEVRIKGLLGVETDVEGRKIAYLTGFAIDDYGQSALPYKVTAASGFNDTISVASKQGYEGSMTAGDHRALIDPDTLTVIKNVSGSGTPINR